MPGKRPKDVWADPNREGRGNNRQAKRYCAKCGNTLQQARILKAYNLCEFCVKAAEKKRDGVSSCRGCGKFAPEELREHHGYCKECICSACGRPDPVNVRKAGLCRNCNSTLAVFCRECGKEAAAQVRKNKGLCDKCVANRR